MTTPKVWRVDVYEQGSRRNVMLRDDRFETTMEIDRDGDLLVEFEVDSESYGGGSRTVRAYYPVESVIEFLREAGPLASRSSSGSGEREAVHAIRDVWLSARTNDDTPPGCYLVDSGPMLHAHEVMRIALSSAPPSPDSGERVRALEEALRDARRCGDKLAKELRGWRDTYVSDDEEDPEGWLALDGWAKSSDARDRALSPQGDGPRPAFIPGGAFCGCGQVEFVCPGSAVARTWSPGAKWPMLHRPDGCRLATDEEIRNLDPSTPEGQPQGDGGTER